jgi:Leucine-rich repeat (LRR) protein
VLNAVGNLIEYLYKDSFKNYTHLKQLNLDVNRISAVQKGTFAPLKELEVISLSRNFLKRVPPGILQLPKLRKLFFNKNELIGGGGFEDAPPRKTLEFLSLAYCSLKEFPSLGMYSNLLELNVSGNDIQRILPQQLAPMCQLHSLDISRNPNLFYMNRGNGCDCHLLDSWIADTNIILQRGYRLNCIPTLHGKTLFIVCVV